MTGGSLVALFGALLGPAFAAWAFVLLRRRQQQVDSPTSRCIGVFMGWNEVKGEAWHEHPSTSHFERLSCVRWSSEVLEENKRTRTVTTTDSEGHSHTSTETYYTWDRIEEYGNAVGAFYVVDDSGAVLVDPEGATIHDRTVVDRIVGDRRGGWFVGDGPTGRIREVERVIAVGDALYVTGCARLRDDAVAPIIDSDDGGPFVVSTKLEEQVTGSLRVLGWVLVVGSIGAFTAGSAFAFGAAGSTGTQFAWPWLPGLAVGLIVTGIGALVLLYNGHVRVANRAARAWSSIDVMLARRHELVPALVATVKANRDHEAALQVSLAALRDPRKLSAIAASEVARDQTEVLRSVVALAEANPELRVDTSFRDLQARLSDTEDRLSAARDFYNESVTALRNRVGTFPGILVARFVDASQYELFAADGFERSVPEGLFPTLRAERSAG